MNTLQGSSGVGNVMNSACVSGLTVKNVNNPDARLGFMRSNSNKSKNKKPLNYNPREISGQLLRAGKSGNATRVLSRAKSKVSLLKRCKATGQYDEAELNTALAHAQRLVKCARIKVRNLKQEEQTAKKNEREYENEESLRKNEIRRKVNEAKRKKYTHRNDERRRVSEADMKYYSDRMKNNPWGQTDYSGNGVSLELSYTAAGLSELKMNEQAMRLMEQQELQAQAELETELSQPDAQMTVGFCTTGTVGGTVIDVSV
ncbi:MAG: hypothetical protein ACI4R6_07780 [Lachnospiraceae bacterium]